MTTLPDEVYVLTHEYSDKSGRYICGVVSSQSMAITWINGGEGNHAYRVPVDVVLPTHPRSDGWEEWTP